MASNTISRIAERASESLYEDEKLRSNLTDTQAETVLGWASDWLDKQVNAAPNDAAAQKIAQTQGQKVRKIVSALNSLARNGDFTTDQGMTALEPLLKRDKSFSRDELVSLLDKLTNSPQNLPQ